MSNISAIIPSHDEQLPDDILTTLTINYRWRRIIAPLLWPLVFDAFWDGTATQRDDAKNKALDLIIDLYTTETAVTQYHGCLIGRSAILTIPPEGINIPFTDEAGAPLHDTDGFWIAASPEQFIVPVGLGGFYFLDFQCLWASGSGLPRVDLRNLTGAPIYDQSADDSTVLFQTRMTTRAVLNDGDGIIVRALSAGSSRQIIKGAFNYAAVFGMYRVGLA